MNRLLTKMLAHADPSQVEGLARFFKTGPGYIFRSIPTQFEAA